MSIKACRAALMGASMLTLAACISISVTHDPVTHDAETVPVAAEPVAKVIDTTGAGDAYIAGFLAARLNGADVPMAMAAGHTCAAACCGHPGGFPQ